MLHRLPGWEHRLATAVTHARSRPFAWGEHDCATWAFELRRDLTGGPDVAALWRGRYRTGRGAIRVMRRLGWASLQEMGRDLLGDPLPSVLLAQRGDVVLGAGGTGVTSGSDVVPATGTEFFSLSIPTFTAGFGICLGASAAGIGPGGLALRPLATCTLAWRL